HACHGAATVRATTVDAAGKRVVRRAADTLQIRLNGRLAGHRC
ncbi:MAG: hypothetical protein QOF86_2560, partial [Baekduia sp.]|nr:hypothetical protein [Baekduia sp.]